MAGSPLSGPAAPVAPVAPAAPLAFITGASSGIGQALAERCVRDGWRVALVARREDSLHAWAAAQGLGPDRCGIYRADVADIDSIVAAGHACVQAQGLPDVVIASAGISIGMDTGIRGDLDVMRDLYATNNLGMAATFHPFLGPMRARRRGTLVAVASVGAIRGMPGHGAYCSSKSAVITYAESLRGETRADGLKVVTLVPGYVATPLTARNPYTMPFLMTPAAFADRAWRAILAGDSYRVIPWQMGVVAKLLRLLPNRLFDRLFAGRGRKPRRGD